MVIGRGSLYNFQILAPYVNIYKNIIVLMQHILVNNTRMLHTDNNIKELEILKALNIKFRQPIIYKINLETSDNILKCLK